MKKMSFHQLTSKYSERFTFTGKERDSETGYCYFGARYYDSELSGLFLSVDPMADKYPMTQILPLHEPLLSGDKDGAATHIPTHKSHTQSALRAPQELVPYCAWNPLKLVDPDGMEIWIVGDDGNTYQYLAGKLYTQDGKMYEGTDAFANRMVSCLNDMSSSIEGLTVVAQLEASETKYTYKNESPSNSFASGGFSDKTQDFKVKDLDFGSIAHESFHAYQYDCGMRGSTDVREVGAYLFQAMMIHANRKKEQWSDCGMAISLFCGDGQYSAAMNELFTNGFSQKDYSTAVNSFFSDSYYGRKYSKIPYYKHATIPDEPPIKGLLTR